MSYIGTERTPGTNNTNIIEYPTQEVIDQAISSFPLPVQVATIRLEKAGGLPTLHIDLDKTAELLNFQKKRYKELTHQGYQLVQAQLATTVWHSHDTLASSADYHLKSGASISPNKIEIQNEGLPKDQASMLQEWFNGLQRETAIQK